MGKLSFTNKGRVWLGYCLSVGSPGVCWALENRGVRQIDARMIAMAVLVAGVMLTLIGLRRLSEPSSGSQ